MGYHNHVPAILVTLFLGTGCAAVAAGSLAIGASTLASGSEAPLLPGIEIATPGPEVPPDLAAFAGAWQARIGEKFGQSPRGHVIVVERIVSPDDVSVVFGIGRIPNNLKVEWAEARSERVKARFESGRLIVRSGKWVGTYFRTSDGLAVDLGHPLAGGVYWYRSTLRQVNLAEVRKDVNAR